MGTLDYFEIMQPAVVDQPVGEQQADRPRPRNATEARARANASDPAVTLATWHNKLMIALKRLATARKEWVAASELQQTLERNLKISQAEIMLSGELSDKTKYRNAEEREAAIALATRQQVVNLAKAASDARAKQAAMDNAKDEFEAIKWTLPIVAQTLTR